MTITCTTEACPNLDVPIEVEPFVEMDGEQIPVGSVICGGCGNPVEMPA